jgi:hypothetical protein
MYASCIGKSNGCPRPAVIAVNIKTFLVKCQYASAIMRVYISIFLLKGKGAAILPVTSKNTVLATDSVGHLVRGRTLYAIAYER